MSNDARILQWREDRAKVADAARQDRLAAIQQQREAGEAAEELRRRDIVDGLLPSHESLAVARDRLIADRAQRRRRAWLQGLLVGGVPVVLTVAYLALFGTPLYETRAIVAVESAAAQPGAPTAGIFSIGVPASTLGDAFSTREYMLSPELLRALDADGGFVGHYRGGSDPLARPLRSAVLGLDDYAFFRRRVHVDVDVQAGLLLVSVQARTAAAAVGFADRIVALAQQRVDQLAEGVNRSRLQALEQGSAAAGSAFERAEQQVASVQRQRGELSPAQTAATYYQVIGTLETQAAETEARRDALLANGLTESPMLPKLTVRLGELRHQIAGQRARLAGPGGATVQRAATQFEAATIRRDLARDKWQSSLRTLEQARLSGLDHKRYLVLIARPMPSSIPTASNGLYAAVLVLVLSGLIAGLLATLALLRRMRTR